MSYATCHVSPTPTATATDPPHANSSTMHSRLVHQDRTKVVRFKYIRFLKLLAYLSYMACHNSGSNI